MTEEEARWAKTFRTPNVGGYEFDVHVHMHKEREHKLGVREKGAKSNAAAYLKRRNTLERNLKKENREAGEHVKSKVDEGKREAKEELHRGIAREEEDERSLRSES